MKTLQEKIAKLESQGWEYDDDFRVPTAGNTLAQLRVMKKGNQYKAIDSKKGTIGAAKQILSDEDYEFKESCWGGKREGAGRPVTDKKGRLIRLNDDEYEKVKEFIKELRKDK